MKKTFQNNPQITQISQIRQAEGRTGAEQSRQTRSRLTLMRGHWRGVPHSHVGVLALSLAFSVFDLCNLRNLWTPYEASVF
jgi:hypothetical protein